MHFRCVFYMLKSCVLVVLDWVEPMIFLLLHVTCSCIFHAYVPLFSFLSILFVDWYFSVSLSLSFQIVCTWHPSAKLLRPETLFVLGHLLPLILLLYMFGSVMRRPVRTSRRTSLGMAFFRNARSSFWIFPILTYSLSFTVGIESPFVTS